MKQLLSGITAVITAVILIFSAEAFSAQSGILIDACTGRIIFEKNIKQPRLIASTTKIMTAILICERCNVLDTVKITPQAVGTEGSSMYLRNGEILTVQELLYGLMLSSGNDAAVALALFCSGTINEFCTLMNQKAAELGMKNTHFQNPNGLDDDAHYSTAEDMAILARYAMKNPIFRKIVSTKEIHIGSRTLRNHNKLLWMYPGADGIKTGYTRSAGRTLVSSAMQEGRRLIAVTLHDRNDWADHISLYRQGFKNFHQTDICAKGQILTAIQIACGEEEQVQVLADKDFSFPLFPGETVSFSIPGPNFVYAPVVEGQQAGYAIVQLGDGCIGRVPIIYGKTVERIQQKNPSIWDMILKRISLW